MAIVDIGSVVAWLGIWVLSTGSLPDWLKISPVTEQLLYKAACTIIKYTRHAGQACPHPELKSFSCPRSNLGVPRINKIALPHTTHLIVKDSIPSLSHSISSLQTKCSLLFELFYNKISSPSFVLHSLIFNASICVIDSLPEISDVHKIITWVQFHGPNIDTPPGG